MTVSVKTTTGPIVSITSKTLSAELLSREKTIRSGLNVYQSIGESLNVIANEDLYKERGFKTFETYVETFFDITRDYAYKMIAAYRVSTILSSEGFTGLKLPQNESQCRPLATLEDKFILTAWSQIVDQPKRITAKLIKEVCDKVSGKAVIEPDTPVLPKDTDLPTGDNPGEPMIKPGPVVDGEKMYTEQEVGILKGQLADAKQRLATAEAKLMAERQTGVLPGGKMARMMIQAGFKAMCQSMDAEEQKELLEVKKALLG